jgi:NAD(P)-dependent dehydrogenase (short-subunit alcohol dehydrogenase family)
MAHEGADILALDVCQDFGRLAYPLATAADLAETVDMVRATGRRAVSLAVDVRDHDAMCLSVGNGVAELGRLDIVCANAAICHVGGWDEVSPEIWRDTIDTNLTGVWNTAVASIPHLIAAGGGSMIFISSTGGLKGLPFFGPYVAAKHGLVGLARSLANELGIHAIRVNTVHPSAVDTPMMRAAGEQLELRLARRDDLRSVFQQSLPEAVAQPDDVSNAVLFLASDESSFISGHTLAIDGAATAR